MSCCEKTDVRSKLKEHPKAPGSAFRLCAIHFAILLLTIASIPAQVQEERSVKAAYVLNLTRYVEWPQQSKELIIGFLGDGPMGTTLKKLLDGRTSDLRVIRVVLSPTDTELQSCNMVYIADPSPKKIHTTLDKLYDKAVLTVGDSESFARDGGMVGLVRVGDEVKIHINLRAAQDVGLIISSRLLDLSTIVQADSGSRN
jgi:hypothetical protein